MSGIVAIHEADRGIQVERGALDGMLSALAHRGPDRRGIHLGDGVGLAECRLDVIDSDSVDLPTESVEGAIRVALDGTIANFRSLRSQLESAGHSFRTKGDAEVLAAAYREWGVDCVYRLRGAFAFVVWDSVRRELFAARDRAGVKPLYLSIGPTRTHIASEAKALLTIPALRVGIDPVGYMGGIEFDSHLWPSPFLKIVELAPGCTFACTDTRRATSRYWTWEPSSEAGRLNPANAVADFAAALHESVGLELESDGPIALALSGGVDSAALAASLVVHGRRDIATFTFESEGDETRDGLASSVTSQFLKIENTKVSRSLTHVTDEEIRRLAWQAEGEFSLAFLERLEVAKAAAASGAKVLLSGQGVDEVLTGASRSYEVFRSTALVRHLRSEMVPSLRGWPRFAPQVLAEVGNGLAGFMGRNSEEWWAKLTAEQLRRDFARLSNGALRFEDRMCAAAQIEVRVPFLDHELLDFCASIPEGSRAELFTAKRILRTAAARVLPRNIAGRPHTVSSAWQQPISSMALENEGVLALLLAEDAVAERGLFSWPEVELMRKAGDFASLDHVLILHLMDELFIRNFTLDP